MKICDIHFGTAISPSEKDLLKQHLIMILLKDNLHSTDTTSMGLNRIFNIFKPDFQSDDCDIPTNLCNENEYCIGLTYPTDPAEEN